MFESTDLPAVPAYSRPDEWLAGCKTEEKKWSRPPSSPSKDRKVVSLKYGDWLSQSNQDSPVLRNRAARPSPIKIEGAKSIKDSPFFH